MPDMHTSLTQSNILLHLHLLCVFIHDLSLSFQPFITLDTAFHPYILYLYVGYIAFLFFAEIFYE